MRNCWDSCGEIGTKVGAANNSSRLWHQYPVEGASSFEKGCDQDVLEASWSATSSYANLLHDHRNLSTAKCGCTRAMHPKMLQISVYFPFIYIIFLEYLRSSLFAFKWDSKDFSKSFHWDEYKVVDTFQSRLAFLDFWIFTNCFQKLKYKRIPCFAKISNIWKILRFYLLYF